MQSVTHCHASTVQVDKLVGMGAPKDFVRELESLANTHHEQAFLDVMRA